MANQLKLVATIAPANTAVEASTDNGVTWQAVAMSTNGSQQEGLLVNVAAGTYPAGTVKLRAVAFPAVVVSEPLARTVTAGNLPTALLAVGDSLTRGEGAATPATGSYPARLTAAMGAGYSLLANSGVSGQTMQAMLDGRATQLYPYLNPTTNANYAKTYVFVGAGINSLGFQSATPQQTYDQLKTYCLDVVSRGGLPVIVFPTAAGDGARYGGSMTTVTLENLRQQYLTLLRTGLGAANDLQAGGRAFAFGELAGMNSPAVTSTSGYFTADLQHPNDAGYTYEASNAVTWLQQMVAGTYAYTYAASGPPAYNRTFASLPAGPLNGVDGWTDYAGGATLAANGLTLTTAHVFTANPKGALFGTNYGNGEVVLTVAGGTTEPMLRWHHDIATDYCLALWVYNGFFDAGIIQGSTYTTFSTGAATGFATVPAGGSYCMAIRQVGTSLELRVWLATNPRPTAPSYAVTLSAAESRASGCVGLACLSGGVPRLLALSIVPE